MFYQFQTVFQHQKRRFYALARTSVIFLGNHDLHLCLATVFAVQEEIGVPDHGFCWKCFQFLFVSLFDCLMRLFLPISLLVWMYVALSRIIKVHSVGFWKKRSVNFPRFLYRKEKKTQLSWSLAHDFCISYSSANVNGSEAVSTCNSLDFIHSWYLLLKITF